jgi:hypothetical protein
MEPQDPARTAFYELGELDPRLLDVARLLSDIHRHQRIRFASEVASAIYTYLERLLREATL